jgi:glycosyl transferase family 1
MSPEPSEPSGPPDSPIPLDHRPLARSGTGRGHGAAGRRLALGDPTRQRARAAARFRRCDRVLFPRHARRSRAGSSGPCPARAGGPERARPASWSGRSARRFAPDSLPRPAGFGKRLRRRSGRLRTGGFPLAGRPVDRRGRGTARSDLETLVRDRTLDGRVEFTGWVAPREVPALINRASLYLVPSRREAFGLVALEARVLARPVVAADVGGLSEVVIHGQTGLIVPCEDAPATAQALSCCRNGPPRWPG